MPKTVIIKNIKIKKYLLENSFCKIKVKEATTLLDVTHCEEVPQS